MDKWTASEAIYALLGELTTKKEPTTFSAKHDASPAAGLADEFCKRHGLAEPRENWHKNAEKEVKYIFGKRN